MSLQDTCTPAYRKTAMLPGGFTFFADSRLYCLFSTVYLCPFANCLQTLNSTLMKLFYAALGVALVATSCQDAPQTTETTPLLKSDTSFVVGPELPARDSGASAPTAPQPSRPIPTRNQSTTASTKTASQSGAGTADGAPSSEGENSGAQAGTEATEKKGWSKTAKGAVIGGVVGAGTGAVINKKNRAAGAVIGGVLGAGAGAIIGNEMDKKDGRH